MKDIQIVDIDYSAKDPEYKKEDRIVVANISGPFIVPEEGPIYGDLTLRVLKGGIDLIRGTDWNPVEGVPKLSELTGKPVYLYIELKNHIVTSGGELDLIYQRVGKPVISVKTLMTMLEEMIIKGKPTDWETQITGKPASYYPAWHSHDIKNPNELVGFGGLVQLFSSLTWSAQRDGPKIAKLLSDLQDKVFNDLSYTQKLLWGAIMGHSRNYKNPHMLNPSDVDLGNVANNATATPQQDSDGSRSDLYSTPAGLDRVIEESSPESEDFLMQSELPFGYYGSGIYLPPPITGSFEGLGGDMENSVFTLEGNGWLVGLVRAFDGRVKNLYYTYCMDHLDRDFNRTPWLNTYVQYQHPTIQAAGKTANCAISGSDGRVLMVGDQQEPNSDIAVSGNWWICAANSTFDPNSHNLKPVNMDPIINDLVTLCGVSTRPGNFNLCHVGDWVYLFASPNSFVGDDAGNTAQGNDSNAWQTFMWRIPYKDLNDDTKSTITFTRVNVTYDTLQRERRSNKNTFIPQKFTLDGAGKIVSNVVKYNPPVNNTYINRKKAFIIVPNPNNSRLARVKLIMSPFSSYTDPITGAPRGFGSPVVVNYEWDVVSNIWTIDPNWDMPTIDPRNSQWVNPTQKQYDYSIASHWWEGIAVGYINTAGSWVPGFGYVAMRAEQAGPPPYSFRVVQVNRDLVIDKDYDYMYYPNNWNSPAGVGNAWDCPFKMKSPFGVAGFPRLYSDLYSLTSGTRQSPIEIFTAENENQRQQVFYRVTEGGADDNYDQRSALQSAFIPKPIYGRKTNSNFGTVSGLDYGMGYSNRPKRKNATSREVGLFLISRVNIHNNPGAGYNFTLKTGDNGGIEYIKMENDGSVVINLDLDYTLDSIAKIVSARPNKAKQVRIPKSFYIDAMYTAMGADANKLIDLVGSYYISSTPGTGQDQAYSMWQVIYHTTDAPNDAKMIVGMFTWEVASTGADGIKVLRPVNMQYPFVSQHTGNQLRPGNPSNVLISDYFTLEQNLTWGVAINFGLQVRQQHMEILDYESEGPQNMEMAWFPAWQIIIVGNGSSPRIFMRRRNNQIIAATVGVRPQQAFNLEYDWVLSANSQWGWLQGVDPATSGAAIDLMEPFNGINNEWGVAKDKYVMYGATYVEGNWSIFVNADLPVTFNGHSMTAKQTNWDIRDLTDIYRNQTFYIYCEAAGSIAQYDITKILRNHSTSSVLVGIVTTDDFGIVTIDRRQSFSISGFPLTRTRDMGVPVSSGAITEQGIYKFLKRSELYND